MLNMSSDGWNEKWILSPCWSKASYMLPFQVNPTNIHGYILPSVILTDQISLKTDHPLISSLRSFLLPDRHDPQHREHQVAEGQDPHDDVINDTLIWQSQKHQTDQIQHASTNVSVKKTGFQSSPEHGSVWCAQPLQLSIVSIYSKAGSKISSVGFKTTTVKSTKVNWMVISNSNVKDKLNVFFLNYSNKNIGRALLFILVVRNIAEAHNTNSNEETR